MGREVRRKETREGVGWSSGLEELGWRCFWSSKERDWMEIGRFGKEVRVIPVGEGGSAGGFRC